MARSPKDDPRFNDNTWNHHSTAGENCAPGGLNDVQPGHVSPNPNVISENIYNGTNLNNEVYLNKQYNIQGSDNSNNKMTYNVASNNRVNMQNYGNAMLNLGNGQLMRVFYDENNKQLIFPMSGQYELFNHNQGLCDIPLHKSQPSHVFTLNQECHTNPTNIQQSTATIQCSSFPQENFSQESNKPTSNFLQDVLGNWKPNSSGTYSPFGQNYPLNHPDVPILSNNSILEPKATQNSPKRNENGPLSDTSNKKRIVAEVKPMRPSYSDVLAKNTKNPQPDVTRKTKPNNIETKTSKPNNKLDKPQTTVKPMNEENKTKSEKKNQNSMFSGNESGDTNADEKERPHKQNKKLKNKQGNMSRRWSSLDDITTEQDNFIEDNDSQFVLIHDQSEKTIKKEKRDKIKNIDKELNEDSNQVEDDENSQFAFQEGQTEIMKTKKKKDTRNHHKTSKPMPDKKKTTQTKAKKNKPGYAGMIQTYVEHWGEASYKALVWFFYLLSDIARMSLHLSFDL